MDWSRASPLLILIALTSAFFVNFSQLYRETPKVSLNDIYQLELAYSAEQFSYANQMTNGYEEFFNNKINLANLEKFKPQCQNCISNVFLDSSGRIKAKLEDIPRRTAIVFLHHNKAAGTTIKTCLHQLSINEEFGSAMNGSPYLLSCEGRKTFDKLISIGKISENTYDVFNGGYSFGICDVMKRRNCSYFTFLRDPYERVISSYFYCFRNFDQLCGPVDPSLVTIEEWAIFQGSYFFNQLFHKTEFLNIDLDEFEVDVQHMMDNYGLPNQTTWRLELSRSCWLRQKIYLDVMIDDKLRDIILRHVINHLIDWFVVIGLTDEMELSLQMLQYAYNVPFYDRCVRKDSSKSETVNKSSYNLTDETERDEVKRTLKSRLENNPLVRRALKEDLAIYNKAKEIFLQQEESYRRFKGY